MKKLNKLFAILVAMAMVLSLTVISAFAVTPGNEVNTDGTKVEKVLTMPSGVAPTGSITIKATLDTIDGVAPATLGDNTGKIADQVIPLAPGTTEEPNALLVKKVSTDATDTYYYKTENVLLASDYHGGVYKYTITEDVTNWTAPADATKTPDTKTYEMTVNVDENKHVKQVFVGKDAQKRDLFTDITESNYETAASNGTVFKNAVEQDATGTDYNTSKLKAKKTVYADENGVADKDTGFKFHVTLILPDIGTADSAKYRIYDKSAEQLGEEKTVATNADGFDITLADGDYIYFTSVPVGTKATIIETDSRVGVDYTKGGTEINAQNVSASTALEAAVTNTHNATSTTGILMSNLPYIVLALVAIGGMVAYVVVRRRNADEA